MGNYDRTRPIIDGRVPIQGVDPVVMMQEPEELFFRAFRNADYDVCELSLSSFTVRTARGDCPYVGVPVFPSRFFRHTSIYVRTDRGIATPADLKSVIQEMSKYLHFDGRIVILCRDHAFLGANGLSIRYTIDIEIGIPPF